MARDRSTTREGLRLAIESLPRHTRIAMLKGIESNQIIAGAYANGDGICPMLAAHRAGGHTSVIAFAKAWDRFVFRGARRVRARRVTGRELMILKVYLQASLLAAAGNSSAPSTSRPADDVRARRHRRAQPAASAERTERTGDADRSAELAQLEGWGWTRVVCRYDEFEKVLRQLGPEQPGRADEGGRRVLS
jgi:hypothetical protein